MPQFSRKDGLGLGLIVMGAVIAVASLLAATYIQIGGDTFAGFYFGIALGAFSILVGLVALTGLLDRGD